jgi:hypothetical protein
MANRYDIAPDNDELGINGRITGPYALIPLRDSPRTAAKQRPCQAYLPLVRRQAFLDLTAVQDDPH